MSPSKRSLRAHARALVYAAKHARELVAVRREAAATARAQPGIARDLSGSERPDGSRVLIVSLSDDVQQAKLEAILVKALQLQGARVSVVTWRSSWRARINFAALGVRGLVFYDDFAPGDAASGEAAAALAARDVRELLAFEYRGARVGRQALSTVVRAHHEPRVDLDDAATRDALLRILQRAIEGVHRAEEIVEAVAPDELILVERGYASFGSIFDVALQRGIPVVQFQAAHRDDAFQLKRYVFETRDQHPRSLDVKTWSRLREHGLTAERERLLEDELAARAQGKWFMARRISHSSGARGPDALRARLGLDPDRKVAALFSHVLWDASMFYGRDLFPDQGRWFARTVELAAEDDSLQWVVKLHPALYWKMRSDGVTDDPSELRMIRESLGSLPPHMRLVEPDDDVDNTDLFGIVDAGVTIRGTVGLELPRLGIPVLTAGTSDYTGRGFTVDAESVEEYERNIRSIGSLGRLSDEQIETAKLYAFGIFCVRPWRFRSLALEYLPLDEAGATLAHRLRYVARSFDDLAGAEDLAAFARWALASRDADYVDESLLNVPVEYARRPT